MTKRSPEELAKWDAEIEAEYRRAVQQTNSSNSGHHVGRQRRATLIGCPMEFMVEVASKTRGRAALIVAQLIYRRIKVCNRQTITLPADELTALGISRGRKHEALAQLQNAGLIEVANEVGRTGQITLKWTS